MKFFIRVSSVFICGALAAFCFVAANSGFSSLGLNLASGKLMGFAPYAKIKHVDGTESWYQVSSAASDATRGAVLTAAKAAAVSGDTIEVNAGTAIAADLLKDLVNWHFFTGAKVVRDSAGS